MDLWHYPQVNKKSGVMELWDFPNGTPMEQNTLAEETRLITKDIVAITKNLDDAYDGNDIKQTLNYLATSDNKNMQKAYNILKQLVESHLTLEYQLDKANRKIQHQQEIIQQVQPELEYNNESDAESESEYEEEEVYEQDTPVTTTIPFFGSPSAPINFVPSPIAQEEYSPDSFEQAEANHYDEGILSEESEQDEIMNRYQNLMFEDDFSCKPRITRNNSAGGGFTSIAPNKQTKLQRRQSRKKLHEEANKHDSTSTANNMKKLARVRSNPNVRRFRQKKSYLTRREQWNMEFPNSSPKNDTSRSAHKSSISLDSTALGLSLRPVLDMNRNVPTVIASSSTTKRASPEK